MVQRAHSFQIVRNRLMIVPMVQLWWRLWEFGVALDFTEAECPEGIAMLRVKVGPVTVGIDVCWRTR